MTSRAGTAPAPRARTVLAVLVAAVAAVGAACAGGGEIRSDDLGAAATADVGPGQDRSSDPDSGPGRGDDGPLPVEAAAEPVRPIVEIPDDWPSEIEAVFGRYWLYWDAFAAAFGPPAADPTFAALEELSTPTNWASLQEQLRAFAADGLVLELPEPSITEHLLRLPDATVLEGTEGEEVVLQDCWIDDFVQRTVDGTAVAEARQATLMNVVMRVVGGEWRVDGVTRASPESDGVEQCAELIT